MDDPALVWDWLDRLVLDFGRQNSADLSMAFVRAQRWIDGVVVGIEAMDQLEQNVAAFARAPLTDEQCAELVRTRPQTEERVLDPACWRSVA